MWASTSVQRRAYWCVCLRKDRAQRIFWLKLPEQYNYNQMSLERKPWIKSGPETKMHLVALHGIPFHQIFKLLNVAVFYVRWGWTVFLLKLWSASKRRFKSDCFYILDQSSNHQKYIQLSRKPVCHHWFVERGFKPRSLAQWLVWSLLFEARMIASLPMTVAAVLPARTKSDAIMLAKAVMVCVSRIAIFSETP